ncbi:MAG: hypothetical protein NTV68_14790 [Methanomicrobiales archaeon]|nr:hypothetical protein [Methanomicrobiales archaeon]
MALALVRTGKVWIGDDTKPSTELSARVPDSVIVPPLEGCQPGSLGVCISPIPDVYSTTAGNRQRSAERCTCQARITATGTISGTAPEGGTIVIAEAPARYAVGGLVPPIRWSVRDGEAGLPLLSSGGGGDAREAGVPLGYYRLIRNDTSEWKIEGVA